MPSTKTITVSAFALTPAAGTVTITSPSSSFELSTDQTTWSSSRAIDYTNNAFTKTGYVRFTPKVIQDYSANITFTLAGMAVGAFSVTSISAYLTSCDGSTIQADIEYSTDGTTWTKLNTTSRAFTKEVMTKVDYTLTASAPSIGKLYIRFYPWITAGTSGQSLAVYSVKMTGKVSPN